MIGPVVLSPHDVERVRTDLGVNVSLLGALPVGSDPMGRFSCLDLIPVLDQVGRSLTSL